MKYIVIFIIFSLNVMADETLINQIKQTSSVYNGSVQIDANNPSITPFELMMTNQKIYINLNVEKLNTSALTVINSDSSAKGLDIPTIEVHNFSVSLDSGVVATTCDGNDVLGTDTSCSGRACTVTQRIVSACNASDCWAATSTTDRFLNAELSESFSLADKVEISDCLSDRQAGSKHVLSFSNEDTSANILNGGQISYSLILQNDVTE